MHRTGYTESAAAPGVEPEIRDPAGLMGVKTTNSPDRVEIPPTPPRPRRRDRRTYSPITSSSDEEPPQSTRKLDKFLQILMITPLSLHATLQFLPNLEGRLCCKDSTC